ncbi:MAG: YhcH/YjgK/YiaL family protein [Bacteroidales bacterium]|nr:YhcH/YjgK/YiaL family protein [Bacteroidales bacterium]
MIVDKLENIKLYSGLSDRLVKALNFLKETDLKKMATGKHIIDGDNIFASVSEYEPKDIENCKVEAHKRYIDVQYMISGDEKMGYLPLANQIPVQVYNEEKDCVFYKEVTSLVTVEEGMFAIFFPGDLHQPSVRNSSAKVKKVVVKVRV